MSDTFVYRLVKDNFHSISIWQLWMRDDKFYFIGKGAVVPLETSVEVLKQRYEKLFDAFNYPVVDVKDINEMVVCPPMAE